MPTPTVVPSSGDSAGVLLPEQHSRTIADIGALSDRLWTMFHGVMMAGIKLNSPRFVPSWAGVMEHVAFITGAEVARRSPPPDMRLILQGEAALRQEWNRKLRAD